MTTALAALADAIEKNLILLDAHHESDSIGFWELVAHNLADTICEHRGPILDALRTLSPSPADRDAMVEKVARAIVRAHADNPDGHSGEGNASLWQDYTDDARAAISAIMGGE